MRLKEQQPVGRNSWAIGIAAGHEDMMATYTIRRVEDRADEVLEAAITLLAEGFYHPKLDAVIGGLSNITRYFRAHCMSAMLDGEVVVAEVAGVGVVAAAFWYGPGHLFLATEESRNQGYAQFMDDLSPEIMFWWTEYRAIVDDGSDEIYGLGARKAGWHLQLIGTAEPYQRQGIATALMEYGHAKADKDGLPCFLETFEGDNVKFYERRGYALQGKRRMTPMNGSERFVAFMRREARSVKLTESS